MTVQDLELEGTLLTASTEDRLLTYRLAPFGEEGRTSLGRVTLTASSITVPDDVTGLAVNIEHDRKRPVGKFVAVGRDNVGLTATIRVLPTSAGDDLLVEAAEGVRRGISVELASPVIRNGTLVASTLSGAGVVVAPAYPSALLVAADAGELPADATATLTDLINQAATVLADQTVPADPAEENTPPEGNNTEENTVEASLTASVPGGTPPPVALAQDKSFRQVVELMASAQQSQDPELFAALSDIKVSGTGAVGVAALQPGWLGELWSGRAYARRYVPLFTQAPLTGMTVNGWRWTTKPEVGPWAGNKAAVPSNAPATEAVPAAAQRLAGAHDVDRAYRDFNVTEFWDSYFRAMTESYARQSDAAALAAAIAGATAVTGTGALADTTAWSLIVDAALAVIDGGGTPSYAVVGSDLYREALLTPKDEVLALLNSSLGLEEGEVGTFKIVPSSDAALTGKVLAGDKASFTFYELPGSPIRVEALDMVKGGVDPGLFGYYATVVNDEDALVLASAPAGP